MSTRKSMIRSAIALALSALAFAATAQAPQAADSRAQSLEAKIGPTLARITQTKAIRLGYRPASSPMSYMLEGAKEPTGYGTDVCLEIVAGMRRDMQMPDLKIEWISTNATERFDHIKNRKIDIECANTTVTSERRQIADFSVPYYVAGTAALVGSKGGIASVDNLRGKKVGVQSNTSGENVLKYANGNRQLNLVPVMMDPKAKATEQIEAGTVDAVFDDDIVLAGQRAESKDPGKFTLLPVRFTVEPLALMLPKGDKAFVDVIDVHMRNLMKGGSIQRLYDKWFTQPIPPRNVNFNLPMPRDLREILRYPTKIEANPGLIRLG